MANDSLECCGSTNWATFNVRVTVWNDSCLFATMLNFVHRLDHLADDCDAKQFYAELGGLPAGYEFGVRFGERECDIDFFDLAEDLRGEQGIPELLEMGYVTIEELEEVDLIP